MDRPLSWLILPLLVVWLWIPAGCNRYARYRVLSTVFDGVPPPNLSPGGEIAPPGAHGTEAQDEEGISPLQAIRFRHPAEGKESECGVCHGDPRALVIPGRDMCLQCHMKVKENRAYIHGPAVLDCIVCHDPHEGKSETLLRIMGNDLCFICHYTKAREDAYKTEAHREGEGETFRCLDCHDPHGGNDRFFARVKQRDILKEPVEEVPARKGVVPGEMTGEGTK